MANNNANVPVDANAEPVIYMVNTCCDIYDAIMKVDANDIAYPNFVCDPEGIGRVPRYSPEDLNVVAMDQRLREMETQLQIQNAKLESKIGSIEKNEDDVIHLRTVVQQHTNAIRRLDRSTQNVVQQTTEPEAGRLISHAGSDATHVLSVNSRAPPHVPNVLPRAPPSTQQTPAIPRQNVAAPSYSGVASDLNNNPGMIRDIPKPVIRPPVR